MAERKHKFIKKAKDKADAPGKLGKEARPAETPTSMHGSKASRRYRGVAVKKG